MQKFAMNIFNAMCMFCGVCLMFVMCVLLGGIALKVLKFVLEWANVL